MLEYITWIICVNSVSFLWKMILFHILMCLLGDKDVDPFSVLLGGIQGVSPCGTCHFR